MSVTIFVVCVATPWCPTVSVRKALVAFFWLLGLIRLNPDEYISVLKMQPVCNKSADCLFM